MKKYVTLVLMLLVLGACSKKKTPQVELAKCPEADPYCNVPSLPTGNEKPYACVAGPNEICASDKWFADFKELKRISAKYTAPQKDADLMQGMLDRLRKDVPQGYEWDDTKERFVKSKTPPPPAPTPTPEKK